MNYSVLIAGCQKNEDIAQRMLELISIHWKQSINNIVVCTDYPFKKQSFKNTIAANSDSFKIRLLEGIKKCTNEYIILLLDDYFITKCIDNKKIEKLIGDLVVNNVDYCRLIGIPKCHRQYKPIKTTYYINIKKHYGINLQPSIWKKDTLLSILEKNNGENAWETESRMSYVFDNPNALCITYNSNVLSIKNGLLRGRLFPYTNKLLIKNNLEPLDRKIISKRKYLIFLIRQNIGSTLPNFLRLFFKKIGKFFGREYYTDN